MIALFYLTLFDWIRNGRESADSLSGTTEKANHFKTYQKNCYAINTLIDFILRRCKSAKSKAYIFARISVDGERADISLKEQIPVSEWDNIRQELRGTGVQTKGINQYIDDVRFKIKQKYRMLLDKEALITTETVKQAYLGVHTIQKGHKLIDLLDYYKKISEPKLKNGGFKNYKTTIAYIKRFLLQYAASGDI